MRICGTFSILLAVLFFAGIIPATAQETCGTDALHQYLSQSEPGYVQEMQVLENFYRQALMQPVSSGRSIATIPVVFHVIHLGEPEGTGSNVSNSLIYAALQGLNQRFRNQIGQSVDLEIEFCLANVDPNGCFTSGINRVDGSVVPDYESLGIQFQGNNGANETAVKGLSRWPNQQYYNIWVVHFIADGWGGYAYYPTTNINDGTVIRASFLDPSRATLAHELGHAFNLRHTFNGDDSGNSCPPDSACTTTGDFVCDTPPHKTGDCGATNPCSASGIWDNSRRNYMSYCGTIRDRFTSGQKARVTAALLANPRAQLALSNKCSGVYDFEVTVQKNFVQCGNVCTGFINLSVNCPASDYTYQWNTGDTNDRLENICAGVYTVTVTKDQTETKVVTTELEGRPPYFINADINHPSCAVANDGSISLNVSGGTPYNCLGGLIKEVGNRDTLISNTSFPSIFGSTFLGVKTQILYHAQELLNEGFQAGYITVVNTTLPNLSQFANRNYENFQIKIGTTIQQELTHFVGGLETCYAPKNIQVSLGNNFFGLDVPFYWDGQSNMVLEFCFDNANWLNPSSQNQRNFLNKTSFNATLWQHQNQGFDCNNTTAISGTSQLRPAITFTICDETDYYFYQWSNNATEKQISGLSEGMYAVTVSGLFCSHADSFYLEKQYPEIAMISLLQISCFGAADGELSATASGGTPPYNFYLEPPVNFSEIPAGDYQLLLLDSKGCGDTVLISVTEPDAPEAVQIVFSENKLTAVSLAVPQTVLWYFEGELIEDCTTTQCNCIGEGNYTAAFIFPDQCRSVSEPFHLDISCISSVKEVADDDYKVYPIPAENYVVFENRSGESFSRLMVYDITGKETAVVDAADEMILLNTTHFQNGLYFYRLIHQFSNKTITGKIIIAK